MIISHDIGNQDDTDDGSVTLLMTWLQRRAAKLRQNQRHCTSSYLGSSLHISGLRITHTFGPLPGRNSANRSADSMTIINEMGLGPNLHYFVKYTYEHVTRELRIVS